MLLGVGAWAPGRQQPDWAELICQEDYTWDCGKALRVMWCESRGDPLAYNAGNYGLWQINAVHRRRVGGDLAALFDPAVNTRVAHEIYSEQGFAPWDCRGM